MFYRYLLLSSITLTSVTAIVPNQPASQVSAQSVRPSFSTVAINIPTGSANPVREYFPASRLS